jgi:acetyl-CoA acetyltransferase
MTRFGRFPERTAADLGREAIVSLLADADVAPTDIDGAYVGRSFSTLIDGQVCAGGQVALRGTGIQNIPVVNFENACASAVSALHCATLAIASGQHECILVVGMDKLFSPRRDQSMEALFGALDVQEMKWMRDRKEQTGSWGNVFMDNYYAKAARDYLAQTSATADDLAQVAVKNRQHAAANPFAQYRHTLSRDEVLRATATAGPLTKLMCSPLSDGAAAMLVCTQERAARITDDPVRVAACVVRSGIPEASAEPHVMSRTAVEAFGRAGLKPSQVDVSELHDASAAAELIALELIGFCGPGEGVEWLRSGATSLGGRMPVNVSGGLLSRGHPGAATGAAQIVELVWQLQGKAEGRQVRNARVGLAQSAGARVGLETACTGVTILSTAG